MTEKADGIRKLVFFGGKKLKGKVFLIDTNMNIQFTGSKTTNKEIFNSIIDGEHIIHDKLENNLLT